MPQACRLEGGELAELCFAQAAARPRTRGPECESGQVRLLFCRSVWPLVSRL